MAVRLASVNLCRGLVVSRGRQQRIRSWRRVARSHQSVSSRRNYARRPKRNWTHRERSSPPAGSPGSRKTLATSCHDDYLSAGDARRRSEPMKQSAWDESIFHLFRARALPSVGPAMRRRPSARPLPGRSAEPNRAAGGIELYV